MLLCTAQNSGRVFVFAATLVPRRRDIRHENVRERGNRRVDNYPPGIAGGGAAPPPPLDVHSTVGLETVRHHTALSTPSPSPQMAPKIVHVCFGAAVFWPTKCILDPEMWLKKSPARRLITRSGLFIAKAKGRDAPRKSLLSRAGVVYSRAQ